LTFNKLFLISLLLFFGCKELPTDSPTYEKKPVMFGSIDAGFNRLEPIYLSWTNDLSSSHLNSNNFIENAEITLSTINNVPEYNNISYEHIENGEYHPILPSNVSITPGSQWQISVNFDYLNENYQLFASTIIPSEINISSIESPIPWNCNGIPVLVDSNFNLYQSQNNIDLISDWLENGDVSFLDDILVDSITYKTNECYTSSFVSVPFFTIDLGVENENIISRYTTISLETNKDMNNDGYNLPYEAAIFDTTLSATAFKGPMNFHEIDYSIYPNIGTIPYEWGWYRDPIDRINLTGNIVDIMWLFFDYYGINMMIIQPMGDEYSDYYEGDPDEFNAPYNLRKTNIQSNQGDAYGLFYSTNSKFFFFNVLKEIE
tara:strand:- start:317 stop:1441 length:1125 start_codon:yes stop_codon:yes gene_type:complete